LYVVRSTVYRRPVPYQVYEYTRYDTFPCTLPGTLYSTTVGLGLRWS